MKLIKIFSLAVLLSSFSSCNGQKQKEISTITIPKEVSFGKEVAQLGKNIDIIYQDKNNNYWIGTNGDGLYHYDGKTLKNCTTKEGLPSNNIFNIKEFSDGTLWFSTLNGAFQYDGKKFIDHSETIKNATKFSLYKAKEQLFFNITFGMCSYDGNSFSSFVIHPESYKQVPSSMSYPYSVYSSITDSDGNIWFGTQERGVCKFDGKNLTFYTDEGLDIAAVRTLYQDKNGTIWAGNNGAGLFRFNGEKFVNFSKEKEVLNLGFLKKLETKDGKLSRPWTINEDEQGNLWIGTIDTGLWKYDGTTLTNYTTKNGLQGNAIWTIYKNKNGELWFVSNGDAINKFNGTSFEKINF